MSQVATDLRDTRERAREVRFEPAGTVTQTNVQKAIEQVATTPQAISFTAVNFAMSPYTVLPTDTYLAVDSSGGPITINLSLAAARTGFALVVKDTGGQAQTNNIAINRAGAETIDGLTQVVINANYGGYSLGPKTGGYTLLP